MTRQAKGSLADLEHFSEVVSTIYDCAVDPHCWPTAIEQIAGLVDGINGVIMVIDTVENKSRFYVDWNVDPVLMQTYSEKYHADNPLQEGFGKFDVEEPYNVSLVMEPSQWLETRAADSFGSTQQSRRSRCRAATPAIIWRTSRAATCRSVSTVRSRGVV